MIDTSLKLENLLEEIYALAQIEEPQTQENWNDLVDEVIQVHIDMDEFTNEQDINNLSSKLKCQFDEYSDEAYEKNHKLDNGLLELGEE
jgi:uncharacterized protein YihD (DUF1040 family)